MVVSLSYELKVNGELVDTATANEPLEFIYGRGALIPKFEEYILNKAVGDTYEFTIPSSEGYGEVNEDAIVEIPRGVFEANGHEASDLLVVGERLPMLDQEGNSLEGIILEVAESYVVMDFNHPLAGEDLHFVGKVEAIRSATPHELEHGHVHSNSSGCGCNS